MRRYDSLRRLWSELAREVMVHAQVFNQIRGKVVFEHSFSPQWEYDLKSLRDFVNKAREPVREVEIDISKSTTCTYQS